MAYSAMDYSGLVVQCLQVYSRVLLPISVTTMASFLWKVR